MQPPRILAFVFSVLTILFLVSIVFPKEGIRINDRVTLQFLSLEEILKPDSVHYADISEILSSSVAISDSAYLAMLETTPEESLVRDTLRANEDSLKLMIHPIEYPEDDTTLLYPFFRKMRRVKGSGNNLRIMHYGDSQIEGDRMTSFIRYKLQDQFGGSGIGIQPLVQLYGYQLSLRHTASDNWWRYTAFGKVDSTLEHTRYGALGCFARFSPYPDSLETDTLTYEAWVTLEQSRRTYYLTRMFNSCHLYYGNATQPVYFEVYTDGELYDADFLEVSDGLQIKTWTFGETPEKLSFEFKSSCSPDFYGIALDNDRGVSVDNVPMRGSAGLVFSKMDADLLKQMYDSLNVKLLLLQFGGNVVPYISDNYTYYERWFYRELTRLKSLVPDLSIIVIGVADMSVKEKDQFVSYSNLENVRDALKNAAFRAGCPFWDMYGAMGGHNSMPSWVFAQPPLATADFVHFNERGARVLAEMFYNAFMHDYNSYASSIH
ncbi:hypothetical protein ACFLTU_00785 [Bacteroidota bacterium]